jgi:cysteine desulfurase/selenocysteine lyase
VSIQDFSRKFIDQFKDEFKDRVGIHFNSAGASPISRSVAERASIVMTRAQFDGSFADAEFIPLYRDVRARVAQLIGAEVTEVAFTQNTASALSHAALGFPLKLGDSVVTVDQEYSSNFYPWKVACERSGATLVVVKSEPSAEISLEKLKQAIVPGVKLVGVSWVQFQTGTILDLKALGDHCHAVGAYLVVDAIQGLGQLPFSFRDLPVDFVACGSHKWLCSLHGQGFFAVKPDLMNLLQPILVGGGTFNRHSMTASADSAIELSARRFEPGGLSYMLLFALDSAIQVILDAGVGEIERENARLSRVFRGGLLEHGVELATPLEQRGSISSFKLPIEQELSFLRRCREERVALVKRGEFIRASIHAFCNDDEVEQVLQIIREVKG